MRLERERGRVVWKAAVRVLLSFSLVLVTLTAGLAQEGGPAETPRPRVSKASLAVMKLTFTSVIRNRKVKIVRGPGSLELSEEETRRILEGETSLLTDKLTTGFVKSGKFRVVEREQLQKIMDEQALTDAGVVDPDKAIEMGRLLGADYLLLGSISLHQLTEKFTRIPSTTKFRRTLAAQVIIDIKLVNAETGRIVSADNARARRELSQLADAAVPMDVPGEFVDDLHLQLVETVVEKVLDAIYPAKVIAFTNGVITFNRGQGTGVKVGDTYEVYLPGEDLIDPDTGESLGSEEVLLCQANVIQVQPKFAKARVVGQMLAVPRGAVLRRATPAAPGRADAPRLPGDD